LALISSTANSTPFAGLRAEQRQIAGEGGGQTKRDRGKRKLATSAFDSRAMPAERQITAVPRITLFNEF